MENQNDLGRKLRDPDWYVHRYDPIRDAVHLIPATRQMRRQSAFLTDEYLAKAIPEAIAAPRIAALRVIEGTTRQHFIFHSAFCCSTLLANALDHPGSAMTFKEPVLLNDLSGWRRRGAGAGELRDRLGDMLRLLGASTPTEACAIIKPSNVTLALAPAMLTLRPDARALLLYAPLETFVASVASKGMWGRLWVRDLWKKLAADGLCELGFETGAAMEWTDLQVAAMGWLAQHRLFAAMADQFGPRVVTMDSAALLANPRHAIGALSAHFALGLSADAIRDIVDGPAFSRNAKTGERFGPADRDAVHAAARAANRDEVEKVAAWTRAVAQSNDMALALPRPLLG
ncbi:hypothetical protein [Sphingomonas sp.]|uniref:hypothetical protein n=1 Tax=Sphingomonas sp. TaxID=28214 RepID=UPI002CAAF6AD|nr:hypothetical protein [Sphingomonas sp.]HTG37535.1 hypothetical protein [Sphingomonas sp.]